MTSIQSARPISRASARRAPARMRLSLRLRIGFQFVALLVAVPALLPLIYLVIRALEAGEGGLGYVLSAGALQVLWNSVALTAAVVLSAAAVGIPFAWLTARTDLPLRRWWLILGLTAMVIPTYLTSVMFIAAFGPRGVLQGWLEAWFGLPRLPSIYGFFGAWLVLTLCTYPYFVIPLRAALLRMNPALEETARSLGLSRWQVFRRVLLPQMRPALVNSGLVAALYSLSDFGAVAMMQYNGFTRAIFVQYSNAFDRHRAAILALTLVGLTLLLLLIERRLTRNLHSAAISSGTPRPPTRIELRRWKLPALLFCSLPVLLGTVIPFAMLVYWMLQKTPSRNIEVNFGQMSANTIGISLVTALLVALVALPLGVLAARSGSRISQGLVRLSYVGYVLPGIVVGLALVYFVARYLPALYQTIPVLVTGYGVRFLSLSVGATRSALDQIPPQFDEAARGLGLFPWQVVRRVTIPLARVGIVGGLALVFLNVMKELPITLLLAPTGFHTYSYRIWSAYQEAVLSLVALPAIPLILSSAAALYVIVAAEGRQVRRDPPPDG